MTYRTNAELARPRVALAVAAAAILVAAGCGGGDDSAKPSGGTQGSAPPAAAQPPVKRQDTPITDYLAYVGGTSGAADSGKSPIAIGWVNSQGGQNQIPEATLGAQAAVKYVNAELGGVDGHPVTLKTCFIASAEEEGQKCGQQLLNDKSVSIIDYGAVVTGNQSLEATVAGKKPIMVGVSAAPADSTAKNTYILYGDQTHVLAPWGTYARDFVRAKTAAVVFPSQAGANSAAAAAKKGLEDAGVKVKSVGYDTNATDLLGPLTAAGGQEADVVVPMTDAAGCVNLAKALKQIASDKPVVSNPLCLSPQVAQGLGDLPVGWVFGIAQILPGDATQPDAKAYVGTSTKYGLKPADTANPYAALGWDSVLTTVKLMNKVGADKITPEAMSAQLKAFKGPLIMGAPSVSCGKYPDAPAVCNDQTTFYKYLGKGKFQQVSNWLTPPR
ncbi:MAG TPA: ABC transporter substrate-binding protein [Streptosporangiaceae bacterium]|nr:ABC transporter substrate-binding protein [Streptosporangiaceae bacterium]